MRSFLEIGGIIKFLRIGERPLPSVEGVISISPDISFSTSWTNDQTIVLSITGNLSYNTTYTITIDTGAKDLAGNTLASD